jgi:multimeric flavodoxin WrbA
LILGKVFEVLQKAGIETDIIHIGGRGIRPCSGRGACFKNANGKCIVEDDVLNETVARFGDADGIVLGSPTYFADVTPDMKAFIDRAGMVSCANGNKITVAVAASVSPPLNATKCYLNWLNAYNGDRIPHGGRQITGFYDQLCAVYFHWKYWNQTFYQCNYP